ncbi:C-GCAxxG-C-C family protein [Cellulosilyticum sp. I15G10I2]|uniref:C-GCAxxG-C-C family protein n=1 Tax=Cellulosilyticum sp. I15G10I2 TaxID=1892843 RepID=UPI00085C1C82|nr:C-GCAxxG-C-C family protein [Cellulosilyticum sp. I15G10I2]
MSKVQEALDCFKEGFSCSQAVFATYAKELGMDYETALKVSQAFGGGMGGMKRECGVVTGAYMVISLIHGRTRAEDAEARLKTFELVKTFHEHFREVHKSTVCGELLEGYEGNPHDLCGKYIETSCKILDDLLHL